MKKERKKGEKKGKTKGKKKEKKRTSDHSGENEEGRNPSSKTKASTVTRSASLGCSSFRSISNSGPGSPCAGDAFRSENEEGKKKKRTSGQSGENEEGKKEGKRRT